MRWLERYQRLEQVMMDLDDDGDTEIADYIRDALSPIWHENLTTEDKKFLSSRGYLTKSSDLDKFINECIKES